MLPAAGLHPAAAFLQSYIEEGIPVNTGLPWTRKAVGNTIKNGPHASAFTPEMLGFIRGEMQQRVQDGFSILLHATDTVRVFG